MIKNILYPSRELERYPTTKVIVILLFFLANTVILLPIHAKDGPALHAENCIACHAAMTGGEGSVLYTRDDRNIKSLDSLGNQVNRCQSSLDLKWSDNQIDSVKTFLNESFYQF